MPIAKIAQFSKLLLWAILVLAVFTFLAGLWGGQPAIDTFTATIALAVAAIPEGLPAALTVTLAIGVSRMARRRAIIRKLPAVEALGSVTVIASDKTGTLTQNQMTVQAITLPDQDYQFSGSGYDPSGQILLGNQAVDMAAQPGLANILTAGLLCNDSNLVFRDDRWVVEGDPTEAALISAALKAGLDEGKLKAELPRLDEIPFDSQHQYMATLHAPRAGNMKLGFVKGAVEVLLDRCVQALDSQGAARPLDRENIMKHVDDLAARGLRVLAFASLELPPETKNLSRQLLSSGLTFLGLQGMIDTHSAMLLEGIPSAEQGAGRWHMAAFNKVFGDPIDAALWAESDPLAWARKVDPRSAPSLFVDCGAEDRYGLASGHRALHRILDQRGVVHSFELQPGDHGYEFVRSRLEKSLRFLGEALKP